MDDDMDGQTTRGTVKALDPVQAKIARRFQGFGGESEAGNRELAARRRATSQELMNALQNLVNESKDGDSACHVCVFGLMGHGKSRLLNLLLTSVSNPPNQADFFLETEENDDDEVQVRGDSKESKQVVRVCNEVPSGEGSTTRAYSRYVLPVHTSQGLSRFPFFLVDTIGVKFTDESNPSEAEVRSEFQLVRNQLAGLDFRERMGAFREPFRHKDAASGAVVWVAKGEDVIDMQVDSKSQTAVVTLRGGHTLPAVPLSKLWDPDGRSWTFSEKEGFKDKRSFLRRLDHDLKGRKWWQPTCRAAILVVNPHQEVPQRVWDAWGKEFEAAGFDRVPVISTHSDTEALFGEDAGDFAVRAWTNLALVGKGLGRPGVGDLDPLLVENYDETSVTQKRRWMSEQNGVRGLLRAAQSAQSHERGGNSLNQKATSLAVASIVVYGTYRSWKFMGRFFKR